MIEADPAAFGINVLDPGRVIAVASSDLLLDGDSAPEQLWLRWETVASGETFQSGFVAYASAADAEADRSRLGNLSQGDAPANLTFTPASGSFQAYRLSFISSDGADLSAYSRLLFLESGEPEAVIAHLNRSGGIGPDHQLVARWPQ